jgi:molybdopterin synthase catalytic subunit
LWDIKTYKKFDADRHKKLSLQLGIYKILIENVFKKPVKIGGIILFEGFVKNGDKNTKMTIKTPINVKPLLKEILKNRLKEVALTP